MLQPREHWRGVPHVHDTSSFGVERVVAILSRGVGRSFGSGNETRVLELFADVRWRDEDIRVDGRQGVLRFPAQRRITTWCFRGVWVGEASHPGPPRRHMSRPIEGRDVTHHSIWTVMPVDDDSDAPHPQVQGRVRRRVARGSRFAVLTESDRESDNAPLILSTGQRRSQDDVNTTLASAVAAHLMSLGGGVQCEVGRHISSKPLPTCRDDDNSDDGGHERNVWARVGESHVFPTEVYVQDTVISTVGQDSIPLVPRVVGAQAEKKTQEGAVEVSAMSDCSDTESCGDAAEHDTRTSRRLRLVWNDLQSEHHPNDGRVASERCKVQDSHDRRVVWVRGKRSSRSVTVRQDSGLTDSSM